ncbi:MAG TPA: hydroxymethylglutaryl-CoA lyase [Fimbriimonadales bacterium]|nr:hydroxymethylglutaryl-CoA lyase [Fimbriimonadales bacterium]
MKEKIRIVEVGPRDGLQNEPNIIPTDVKVAFIDALSEAGFEEIEAGAFVSPKWVPQMADSDEVFRRIRRKQGVRYSALVPNEKGLERALEVKVDKIAVFTAASETFNLKNINATIEESLNRLRPVVSNSPVPVRGYVSTAFVCPYEGKISPSRVIPVVKELLEMGCEEISIGDTIGKATTEDVRTLLEEVSKVCSFEKIALHFHDTYGGAVKNALVGAEMGVRVFDASAGGIGGCPYAPGAPGNVATEDLVRAFPGRTGIDLEKLAAASQIVRGYVSEKRVKAQ